MIKLMVLYLSISMISKDVLGNWFMNGLEFQ